MRIKRTKPAGHKLGFSFVRKDLAKLASVSRILASYARGRSVIFFPLSENRLYANCKEYHKGT